jgi:protein TonB
LFTKTNFGSPALWREIFFMETIALRISEDKIVYMNKKMMLLAVAGVLSLQLMAQSKKVAPPPPPPAPPNEAAPAPPVPPEPMKEITKDDIAPPPPPEPPKPPKAPKKEKGKSKPVSVEAVEES